MSECVGLTRRQAISKRAFDLAVALIGLICLWWLICITTLLARIDTRGSGLFRQERVGKDGRLFMLLKLRTMRVDPTIDTTVTASTDVRITRLGRRFRAVKLDELPQLVNVLRGEMSIVGPRPDVPGFADLLRGDDCLILSVRPGITGPAAVAYRDEEAILAGVSDPEQYNRLVIWPDKVRINKEYVRNYSMSADLRCIRDTFRSVVDSPGSMAASTPPRNAPQHETKETP